mmetsp:Transcript_43835/g.92176  ORF Transcript_43835/g.92176 Transcript_43835/m.92176 type:complete len:329 (+) Transcript_43835:298-1284(+)
MNTITTMTLASSASSTTTTSSSYWTAAIVGAIAVVGLWTKQNSSPRRRRRSSGGSGGEDCSDGKMMQRQRMMSDDASDTTISVEGSVMVTLPTWAIATSSSYFTRHYHTDLEMMSLAIHLSDRNISEGTGGPFGAAIFERHPGGYCTLVSIGVNRVVPLGNSTLHGEMVAIQLAQRKVGSYSLGNLCEDNATSSGGHEDGLFYEEEEDGGTSSEAEKKDDDALLASGDVCLPATNNDNGPRKRQFELFTSCEPCAMCLGATLWSGVHRIVCGAKKCHAQAIGFDEGPVFEASYKHLEDCGVKVTREVLSDEAAKVLRRYGSSGLIYNR